MKCLVDTCGREAHENYCRRHLARLRETGELREEEPIAAPWDASRYAIFDEIAQIMRDRDQPWRAQAACLGQPTEMFFPDHEKQLRLPVASRDYNISPLTAQARSLCAECPVSDQCDLYAKTSSSDGLWAGTWRYQWWNNRAFAAKRRREAKEVENA